MRVAALDLGSNTSLLLIAEMSDRGLEKVLHDETEVTRMGQGVHAERRFHPEALARMDACLEKYARTIREIGCEKTVAVATSAARDVSNGEELIGLGRKNDIPIHIISGVREANLTFKGALCDRPSTDGLAVIDVGGGSTEIIREQGGSPNGTSVDVGSVRLSEIYIQAHPVSDDDFRRLRKYAEEAFRRAALPTGEIREAVAVAGTPTTLAALDQAREFDETSVHDYRLTLQTIERWSERLRKMTVAEREGLPGMQPKRADVIVAGCEILAAAMRALKQKAVTVSTRGVRYGVALAWREF